MTKDDQITLLRSALTNLLDEADSGIATCPLTRLNAHHALAHTPEQQWPLPIAWCFRKAMVQKLQWDKPVGGDVILKHWTALYAAS